MMDPVNPRRRSDLVGRRSTAFHREMALVVANLPLMAFAPAPVPSRSSTVFLFATLTMLVLVCILIATFIFEYYPNEFPDDSQACISYMSELFACALDE